MKADRDHRDAGSEDHRGGLGAGSADDSRVRPGSVGAAIVEDEERLHARVQARIALGTTDGAASEATADDVDRELLDLRDQIAEAKPEDLPPLVEQMTRLSAVRARLGGSKSLPIDVRSPYFAHMVLREGDKSRDVLIGKRGFIDRQAGVQIVDWRNAPISQVYYRYDEGDDYDEEVGGRSFEGIIEVRRNLSIHESKLRRIGAPQGTFVRGRDDHWHQAIGDLKPSLHGGVGTAARSPAPPRPVRRAGTGAGGRKKRRVQRQTGHLGVHSGDLQRADKHLPEIAALIDPEQFDLITQPESGMIVIQGGAGSGKTTVALHRVAFLNFADKQKFRPGRMLVVVPTRSLARYVEGVLPALGVSGVPVMTYAGWARKQRLRLLDGTSSKYTSDTPEGVVRLKKHPALLAILERYVADLEGATEAELRQLDDDGELLGEWRRLGSEAPVQRLRKLYRWSKASHSDRATAWQSALTRLGKAADDIVTHWGELLTDFDQLRAGFPAEIRDIDIRRLVDWVASQQAEELAYRDDSGAEIESVDGHSLSENLAAGRFDHEDDPILLRLIQLLRGGLTGRRQNQLLKETWYQHVAIDEAQDRSAIEVKVLLDATAAEEEDAPGRPGRRSVTIAGDTAQRLVFDNHFRDWADLLAQIGYAGADAAALIRPLKLSYRSTAEVMQLAREILGPELAPAENLMARSGAPVELHGFGDAGEAVAFLGDSLRELMGREPSASCAVIARYPEQADLYYAGLQRAEVPALRRVRNHEFDFVPGVDVTDVTQVKGLEFDYVIMVAVDDGTYPATDTARHLLHIGATRAAHQLWLVATGRPSPLLPERLTEGGLFSL